MSDSLLEKIRHNRVPFFSIKKGLTRRSFGKLTEAVATVRASSAESGDTEFIVIAISYQSEAKPSCPKCGKSELTKNGRKKEKQQWRCKSCAHQFTEKPTCTR